MQGMAKAIPRQRETSLMLISHYSRRILLTMNANIQSDPVLRFFAGAVRGAVGSHLKEIILFGSRARGDASVESDYDLLVVVDRVDPAIVHGIDEIAGEALLKHRAVISAFPISEEDRKKRKYSPLLINAAREGVTV